MNEPRSYSISPAVVGQRRAAAMKHGARSERQIQPVARAQKRRLLRQNGLRASDLDGVANALLDNWARAQAKVALLDEHFSAHGFLQPDGEPVPATRLYFLSLNSARLALTRFGEYTRSRVPDRDLLHDYVSTTYGSNGDGDEG